MESDVRWIHTSTHIVFGEPVVTPSPEYALPRQHVRRTFRGDAMGLRRALRDASVI
jgi:hypothetical protein